MLAHDETIGAVLPAGLRPWATVAIALWISAAAGIALRRLRGTTLAAPATWGVAAGLVIVAVEACLAWQGDAVDPLAASLWRYAAAAGTLCPLVAVLGAKRPQDRGWQWVVLSLWVILLVPAMQALAAPSGARLEMFGAWRLLLVALIAMGLLNYLPTRYAAAALLLAMGQMLLFGPYLFDVANAHLWRLGGITGIGAAAAYAYEHSKRPRDAASQGEREDSSFSAFNRQWFAFRDGWGAFWGMRVMQRIAHAAELSGWPVRLEWWNGFAQATTQPQQSTTDDSLDAETAAHIQQTLDTLLRRFERA